MEFGIAPSGFRLPRGTCVGAAHLQVADVGRSINYYERVLGLRAVPAGPLVRLTPQDDERTLLWLHEKPGVTPPPRRGVFGLFHFAILLPERAALGRFAAHIFRLGVRVAMADHFVSESLYLTDPDGLGVEVYADRPRRQWRVASDGELHMGTAPLDVQDLMRDAGDTSWAGAPPGTTMGHMHLHVGSLADAEAFYHRALGFDKTVWNYPGALFFAAAGYHHHLGTNVWSSGPAATDDQARLLEWELCVPGTSDVDAAGKSLSAAGYSAIFDGSACLAADPWGTAVRIQSS